jgi:hypothetical protein
MPGSCAGRPGRAKMLDPPAHDAPHLFPKPPTEAAFSFLHAV